MTNDSGNEENLPLSGVRVLEFGSFLAGPFGTRFLGDFGAEVIKIEARDVPDAMRDWGPAKYKGRSLVWPIQSRNKKSITLNLRTPEAQALARKLIATTDVIVENFRPGTMEKWGLGYEDLKKDNPGLVMVRVSGYGQTGPYKNRAGFGSAAGAMGGLRHLTGYPDRPPTRVGLSIEDSLAALQAVIGTLLALRQREVHGSTGQVVDVSITESVFTMLEGAIPEYALTGHVRNRHGTTLPAVAPSNIYEAKDGVWMVIAANADNPFKRLFDLIGRPDHRRRSQVHEPRRPVRRGRDARQGHRRMGRSAQFGGDHGLARAGRRPIGSDIYLGRDAQRSSFPSPRDDHRRCGSRDRPHADAGSFSPASSIRPAASNGQGPAWGNTMMRYSRTF